MVIMDVMMPRKDGVQACREIMESAPETRVVMLTASSEERAVVDAVAAGATGYLQKETDRERLLSTVRSVVLVYRPDSFAIYKRVPPPLDSRFRGSICVESQVI